MKRCAIKGITRDKEYNLTKGTPKSDILYLTVNPNGEAEVLKVYFKPRPRLKKLIVDLDFSTLAIKGRQSQGNLFSHYGIHKIVLKERGTSTLAGQNIWFDEDIHRLNVDGRGTLLGEFKGDDKIVVWTSKNQYYITGFDVQQHFPDDTVLVQKYEADKVYSLCYFDPEQGYYYMKRFALELSDKMQFFLEEGSGCDFICVTDKAGAKLQITYKGAHATRPADEVEVDDFVGVKSHRAKGKRLTTYDVDTLAFIEPEEPEVEEPENEDVEGGEPMDAVTPDMEDMATENETPQQEPAKVEEEPASISLDISDMLDDKDVAPLSNGVKIEIERPHSELDDMINPEQLNLF